MPTLKLTRKLIADIKKNTCVDYLEIDGIDPNEKDNQHLHRPLTKALKKTTALRVLELSRLTPEAATIFAHAIQNPQCQLKGLVLKHMSTEALSPIIQALRSWPTNHVTITLGGLVGTTCQALYIALGELSEQLEFSHIKLGDDWRHEPLSRVNIPSLLIASQPTIIPPIKKTPDPKASPEILNKPRVPPLPHKPIEASPRVQATDTDRQTAYTTNMSPHIIYDATENVAPTLDLELNLLKTVASSNKGPIGQSSAAQPPSEPPAFSYYSPLISVSPAWRYPSAQTWLLHQACNSLAANHAKTIS